MQEVIKKIIAVPDSYARFLNTLSLMEYIGARKIIKSQPQCGLNEKMLAHIAEEIRHAYLLKRAAVKISSACDSYTPSALLCGKEAVHYFQTLDRAPANELNEEDPLHCYLYTTLLIELRATAFYSLFGQLLQEEGKRNVFCGILAEEQKHLCDMEKWISVVPNFTDNLARLKIIEEQEFTVFLAAVADCVAQEYLLLQPDDVVPNMSTATLFRDT